MKPLRTLLVTTDLSTPAQRAAARAGLLAAEWGACIVLLHVIDVRLIEGLRQFLGDTGDSHHRRLLDAAGNELSRLADSLRRDHGVAVEAQLVSGQVLPEIVAAAERTAAGLVVMGARGAGFLPELLLGATTERVVRMTHHPVLIVKRAPHESYRKILVPVDFSPDSRHAIDLARSVSRAAELSLLHAFELPFERKLHYAGLGDVELIELQMATKRAATVKMQALREHASRSGSVAPPVVLYGPPPTRILEQEQEQDCDLIVIGRGGSGLLADWLLGSTIKRVAALASCDVLVADAAGGVSPAVESTQGTGISHAAGAPGTERAADIEVPESVAQGSSWRSLPGVGVLPTL